MESLKLFFTDEVVVISTVIWTLLGGLYYILRGGGLGGPDNKNLLNMSLYLDKVGIHLRNLHIAAILVTVTAVGYVWLLGHNNISLAGSVALIIGVGYILAFMQGWGQYFDMGTTEHYYVDHREVAWVDWVLFKLYGPLWIPANIPHSDTYYDLIPSPTGEIRPFGWRRKRDFTGMILRHLASLVIFGSIEVYRAYLDHEFLEHVSMAVVITALFAIGTGLIYRNNVTYENLDKNGNKPWRFQQPIGQSEIETGLLLHFLIFIALYI